MARPRINGTLQPIRTKLSTRFDPVKGMIVTQEWESAGNNLAGLALQAKNDGMEYTLEANDRKSRLTISTTGAAGGFTEQYTSTWQLFTNEIQKDLREHPVAVALGPAAVAQLSRDVERVKDGQASYADILEEPLYASANAAGLLQLMLHGVTSYSLSGYAARATINLPFLYAGEIPGVAPDSLMADIIGDIEIGGPDDGILFNWGWRRMGTNRTFAGNNRTEINIEWQLASWAFIYTDVTDLPE